MRKLVLALAAAATLGIAVPAVTSTPASAETTIIKKHGDGDGWRRPFNRADRTVIINRHGHDHGLRRSFNRADRVVIIKKRGHGHFEHGRGYGYGHRHHMD